MHINLLTLCPHLNVSQQQTLFAHARRTPSKKGLVTWTDQVLDQVPLTTKKPFHGLFDPLAFARQHLVSKKKWLVQILDKHT
jgi:hypothetical protein